MEELLLQRAMQSGAFLGTSELLLFQIMESAQVMLNTLKKAVLHTVTTMQHFSLRAASRF